MTRTTKIVIFILAYGVHILAPDSCAFAEKGAEKVSGNTESSKASKVLGEEIHKWVEDSGFEPHTVAFLEGFSTFGSPVFHDHRELNLGFLRMISGSKARWARAINKGDVSAEEDSSAKARIELIKRDLDLSFIAVTPPNSDKWSIVMEETLSDAKKGVSGELVHRSDFLVPPDSEMSRAKWFFKNLGYDGIVVAIKGKAVLVGAPNSRLKRVSQGVVLRDSRKTLLYRNQDSPVSAIIELVKYEGNFAVFQSVLGSDNRIQVGSKVSFTREPQ